MDKIQVTKSKKYGGGRCICANQSFKPKNKIEICPLLILPKEQFKYIKKTNLYYYYFEYTKKRVAIALGYGSLYNHSYSPNARYIFDYKNNNLEIIAIKNIKKGEEILFNYNYYPNDKSPLPGWYKTKF